MNDKFLGWVFGSLAMAACCIGLPLLVGILVGTGVFAWIADNGLAIIAVIAVVAAIALWRREQINQRHRSPDA